MSEVPEPQPPTGLSEHDQRVLGFERSWWRNGTGREQACRDQLGLSPADYHRALNALIDRPEALAYDAVLVRRLRRLRATRRSRRSGRTPGDG